MLCRAERTGKYIGKRKGGNLACVTGSCFLCRRERGKMRGKVSVCWTFKWLQARLKL